MKLSTLKMTLFAMSCIGSIEAATLEQYKKACSDNQRNNMGAELCECVGKEALIRFNEDEFNFFYATAAKDTAATQKYNKALAPQQKMNVIMFTMKGPPLCAGKLSRQGKKPPAENRGSATSSAAETAAQ
ncbi:MAG: hypothetical protein KZQ85_12115 [Candidatus Thiodiazotropha sp. (ex Myrtea sp. 'scaly one' KF741663)]|nr:hypothetical protein [Candidatus Thiodiazotropha sp. (ex Myrtea sp. 'scaly one' KF741663)]